MFNIKYKKIGEIVKTGFMLLKKQMRKENKSCSRGIDKNKIM